MKSTLCYALDVMVRMCAKSKNESPLAYVLSLVRWSQSALHVVAN